MATKQQAEYQTKKIMPIARKEGCKCPYSEQAYLEGSFSHEKNCPSPKIECLPNPAKLMAAMRQVY